MVWYSTSRYLRENRSSLRRKMTPAESKLWTCLHKRKLGVRFRRQHSIGRFILDFYCVKHRLGVELDGGIHDDPSVASYDQERSLLLRIEGIKIIRFKNEEVMKNCFSVVMEIKRNLNLSS